jgi:hypothetical protein
MPRTSNPTTPKKNTTEERLRATVWLEFEKAREAHELLTKPRYAFLMDELKAGLTALTGKRGRDRIYRIFSEGVGMQVEINKDFTATLGDGEIRFLEGVLRAGIEGYGRVYLQTKRLIPSPTVDVERKSADEDQD